MRWIRDQYGRIIVGKSLISPPAWLDRNQPRGRYPKLLIPDPDGLAQCLSKTMRPDSWIRNNEKKPQASSLKPQAPATICHIDTIYSGATIYHLTFILISYIIYDMKTKKGEKHG